MSAHDEPAQAAPDELLDDLLAGGREGSVKDLCYEAGERIKADATRLARLRAELAEARDMLKAVADACQRAERGREKEADDADAVLITVALDPEKHRTEGGRLNVPKIRTAVGERQAQAIRDGIAYKEELTRICNAEAASAHEAAVKAEHRAERAEAERDALREDAERYRWLRNADNWTEARPMPCVATFDSTIYGNALDAAIDAAREGGK